MIERNKEYYAGNGDENKIYYPKKQEPFSSFFGY
jgi:hypothetical protein